MASIIVDGPSSQFTYGGGTWSAASASHYFGGSETWADFTRTANGSDTGVYASFSFDFQGTSVAFFGNTPAASASQWALFSIDGGPSQNSSFMDPSPPSSRQWYQSPALVDAQHNINITHIPSVAVDYAVVTAGQNTLLSGQELIVDDSDSSITYKGSWTQNTNAFVSSAGPFVGLPFGNATHKTTSTDASATFRFTGTGVSVAGIFSFDVLGTLSVNYTLDDSPSVQNYTVTTTTPEYAAGIKQQENFLLFANNGLAAGDHTLEIQVTNCVGQIFELDYIIYKPSFSTLATKPSLSSVQSSSQITTSTTSTSTSAAPPNASTNKSSHVAAIVGGVLGGIVFLLLVLLLLLYRKRFLDRRTSSPPMTKIGNPGPLALEPFILPPVAARTTGSYDPEVTDNQSPSRRHIPSTTMGSYPENSRTLPSQTPQSVNEGDRLFIWTNKLQKLVEELRRESAAVGGEDMNNPRIVELHSRIAELVREGNQSNGAAGNGISAMRDVANTSPPAYELG